MELICIYLILYLIANFGKNFHLKTLRLINNYRIQVYLKVKNKYIKCYSWKDHFYDGIKIQNKLIFHIKIIKI